MSDRLFIVDGNTSPCYPVFFVRARSWYEARAHVSKTRTYVRDSHIVATDVSDPLFSLSSIVETAEEMPTMQERAQEHARTLIEQGRREGFEKAIEIVSSYLKDPKQRTRRAATVLEDLAVDLWRLWMTQARAAPGGERGRVNG